MARISVRHGPQIFIIAVVGDQSLREIIDTMRHPYSADLPCNVLLDFTQGALDSITLEELRDVALIAKSLIRYHAGGWTAYVGGMEVVFRVTSGYPALAGLAEIPIEYSVFKTLAEARVWFGERRETDFAEEGEIGYPAAPLPLRVQASEYSQIGSNLKQRWSTIAAATI